MEFRTLCEKKSDRIFVTQLNQNSSVVTNLWRQKETINKSLRVCDRTSTGISWRIPFHQLFHERMLVHRTGGLERVFLAITLHSRVNNEVKTLWKVLSTCNATVHKKSKTLRVWLRICSAIYDLRKREIFQFTLTVLICVQTFMAWFKELQKLIKKHT